MTVRIALEDDDSSTQNIRDCGCQARRSAALVVVGGLPTKYTLALDAPLIEAASLPTKHDGLDTTIALRFVWPKPCLAAQSLVC